MATRAELIQAYLAYFGRPPDFDGLKFYENIPFADVISNFSKSAESQALYGTTFGAAQVNAIYQNLFNRDAEPAGLDYWSGRVNSGALSPAAAAYGILLGAQNADKTSADNKIAIINLFNSKLDTAAEIVAYSGTAAAASARAYIKTVDSTAASVTAATTGADAAVAAAVGQGTQGGDGTTYTLDARAGIFDNVTGTAQGDTFVAGPGALISGDVVNGGGGIDRVNASYIEDASVTRAPSLTSVERVFINASIDPTNDGNVDTLTFSLGNSTGVTEVWADRLSSGTDGVAQTNVDLLQITNVSKAVTIGVTGGPTATANRANLTVAFSDVTGSTDAATLALQTASIATVTLAGVETLNIAATIGNSTIATSLVAAAAETINISGDKNVTIAATDTATKVTVNASTATGAVSIGAEAAADFTFTGGTGNDRVLIGAVAGVTAADVLNGGTGTNILAVTDASADLSAFTGTIKNFQVFESTQAGAATAVDAAHVAGLGITSFRLSGASGDFLNTLSNARSGISLELTADQAATTDAKTLNITFAAGSDTVNDIVNLTLTNADVSGIQSTANNFANTLNIVSNKGTANALDNDANVIIDLGQAGTAGTNAIGVGTINVTSGNAKLVIGSTDITGATQAAIDSAAVTKVDASAAAFTGSLWFQAATNTATEIVGSAGDDRLIASTKNDIISGGAGADRVTGLAGNDNLTGGAGADVFFYTGGDGANAAAANVDRITDFVAATDKIGLATGADAYLTGLTLTTATAVNVNTAQTLATAADVAAIYAGLTPIAASSATTVQAVVITVSAGAAAGTYLYINDNTAASTAAEDQLINITGLSGTITAADFVLI